MKIIRSFFIYTVFLSLGTAAHAAAPWPDTRAARTEALAILQTLNADLLSHDSATLTLDQWCADHRLADPPKVIAERVRDIVKQPTAEQRKILGVGDNEQIGYRRVRLKCGDHVLSEADNWYVPGRLTPEMNRQLDSSDIAFGRAVQDLHFRRQTLSAELLWNPLPSGWDMGAPVPENGNAPLDIPPYVIAHRAVLLLPDGVPISLVVETYTGAVLDFPHAP